MTVEKIADLISISSPQINTVYNVLGYTTAGDGGGGDFYWDADDLSNDNNGTIFKSSLPSLVNGRWKRLYDGELNVRWFGAKGIKNQTSNDSSAIESCIAYAKTVFSYGGKILFPKGDYVIEKTVDITGMGSIEIKGEGAWLWPKSAITAVNLEGHKIYYIGLNISYELLNNTEINENCVAIWLHKNGTTADNQVNNSIFELFSIIGAHTGIKSIPATGLVWHLDFRSIYFDIYEGVSENKAIAFDIESGFGQGGSTTIKISKCSVQSFITNPTLANPIPKYPRRIGYRGYRLYYSTDVYIVDSSYDGYLGEKIDLNETGQVMDIFSKNIHIDGFHCEALNNKLNANLESAPFKINSTGYLDMKNIIILDSQMNCGGPTTAGAWFLYYGGGPFNFGTYTDNGIASTDNTPVYILSLCNQLDGHDVTNSRPQINFNNAVKSSQVHLLNRNYNSVHFDSLEVNGLVTSINTTSPTTILNVASTRCSMLLAVRGFSQIDGGAYFIDYVLISRSRNNYVKVKSMISDSNNYTGVVNTYIVAANGDIQLARNISTGFWVTAKVVNMI